MMVPNVSPSSSSVSFEVSPSSSSNGVSRVSNLSTYPIEDSTYFTPTSCLPGIPFGWMPDATTCFECAPEISPTTSRTPGSAPGSVPGSSSPSNSNSNRSFVDPFSPFTDILMSHGNQFGMYVEPSSSMVSINQFSYSQGSLSTSPDANNPLKSLDDLEQDVMSLYRGGDNQENMMPMDTATEWSILNSLAGWTSSGEA